MPSTRSALRFLPLFAVLSTAAAEPDAVSIGTRRELFVDRHLVAEMDGVARRLHRPDPQGVVFVADAPWEGGHSHHFSIFRDGEKYRMYYRAKNGGKRTCYAESDDGIHWRRPDLGLHEYNGSTDNNIVSPSHRNFFIFKDRNPDRAADAKYKAVRNGRTEDGTLALYPWRSADGIHWSRHDEPILTGGPLDSQQTAMWDPVREQYRVYMRRWNNGRTVGTATAEDFFGDWSEPKLVKYPKGRQAQHYFNVIKPYPRAPHIYIGFPARYIERNKDARSMKVLPGWDLRKPKIANAGRQGYALTDTAFMSSRDGRTFRQWPRAFIRPGLWKKGRTESWFYGSTYTAWHAVETRSTTPGRPRVLSLYVTENYRADATQLRRYTLRLDGFVSVEAPVQGGELITEPVRFRGDTLTLNYATSAVGHIRVELQKPDGTPYEGFSLASSPELFGDDLDREVRWSGDRSVADLRGKPVRLRFVMADADLYAYRFR